VSHPLTVALPTVNDCAANLALASRFTMEFAMLALVGAMFQEKFSVPVLVTGEPLTLKSDAGAVNPTLVTVPLPADAHTHALPFHCSVL